MGERLRQRVVVHDGIDGVQRGRRRLGWFVFEGGRRGDDGRGHAPGAPGPGVPAPHAAEPQRQQQEEKKEAEGGGLAKQDALQLVIMI